MSSSRITRQHKSNGNKSHALSDGTKSLVESMMAKSKLTKFQKKQLSASLERGSLPSSIHPSSSSHSMDPTIVNMLLEERKMFGRPNYKAIPKRKRLDKIIGEGAYDPDTYKPAPPKFDRQKEREKLAAIMQFNGAKNVPKALIDPSYKAPEQRSTPVKDRFQELVDEIEDRNQFLQDMKRLGQLTVDVESSVKFEIAKMIQEMERIDCKEREKTHTPIY